MKSFRTTSVGEVLSVALLATCFGTGTANGKDPKKQLNNWDNLKTLTAGREIFVVMKDLKFYQGRFESLSGDGITLRDKGGERTQSRTGIFRVSQKIKPDHQFRNTLFDVAIAGGAGAAAGFGIGSYANGVINRGFEATEGCTDESPVCNPPRPHWAAILTPVAALAAGAAGAAASTRAWHDVYRAR